MYILLGRGLLLKKEKKDYEYILSYPCYRSVCMCVQQRSVKTSLCLIDVERLNINAVMHSDGDLKVNFSLHSLSVDDMRPDSTLAIRRSDPRLFSCLTPSFYLKAAYRVRATLTLELFSLFFVVTFS